MQQGNYNQYQKWTVIYTTVHTGQVNNHIVINCSVRWGRNECARL